MLDPAFDSAWLSWAWGVRHGQQLRRDFPTTELDSKSFLVEYDAQRQGFPIVVASTPVLPPQCSMILADAIHSLRAALDHVAWVMVERGRTPPSKLDAREQRRVAFPLCDHKAPTNSKDRWGWVASCDWKLPGVRRTDLALVRSLQPFQYGRRHARTHPLFVLEKLDNLNKHRTIQPVFDWPTQCNIEILGGQHCIPPQDPVMTVTAAIKVGNEIGFIPVVTYGPEPELDINPELTVEPVVFENIFMWALLNAASGKILTLLKVLCDFPAQIETLGITDVAI